MLTKKILLIIGASIFILGSCSSSGDEIGSDDVVEARDGSTQDSDSDTDDPDTDSDTDDDDSEEFASTYPQIEQAEELTNTSQAIIIDLVAEGTTVTVEFSMLPEECYGHTIEVDESDESLVTVDVNVGELADGDSDCGEEEVTYSSVVELESDIGEREVIPQEPTEPTE